ncbi:low molecular weight protein-tyrosine-phosphatase [Chengkuizengella marina]|uniref:protein-tyrosine-phosphatase n=1 Tax=Chengkuizengella marina TaxID=2507566 RepID=A0A6N9Q2W3_9BACL|nr:low molecular weight protein-tyrosine-phosphatase [Chengkuizengella marina]NBI29121.1 low molecular weight phosphotyrosine protein phosphatase [Chengkuizengella marina]
MIRVLFVCLGNICRSPMAEAVFRHKVNKRGLQNKIEVDSAGTGDWHIGNPPHEGTRNILDEYEVDYTGLKARQVVVEDMNDFDYIIAMDEKNLKDLKMLSKDKEIQIYRMLEFLPSSEITNVPDPYFTGNFDEVYEMIDSSCEQLLETMIKNMK